jgi:hypothetical protein
MATGTRLMFDTHLPDPPFPDTVVVEGVVCYARDDAPGQWVYVPADPVAELAGARPAVHLWASPESGILQLGAEWTVRTDVLERVKIAVAAAAGGQPADLQPAPANVRDVSLETTDDRGARSVLAVSPSSGFPPYRAIFRAELNAAATAAAVGALNGRRGCLGVRYRVGVLLNVSVRAQVEGDVAPALAALPADASPAAIRAWLNEAIEARRVVVTVEPAGTADDDLIERARTLALDEFVRLLAGTLAQAGGPAGRSSVILKATAGASDVVRRELERVADVSAWFRPGEGAGHITVVPGAGGGGTVTPGPKTPVALTGLAADLPVAFVEIRCGERKVLLKPPRFEPATLDSTGCEGGLTVTTHFTTGDEPYRTVVPLAEAGQIPPAALGLTEVVVDGRERQAAGARDIRVRLELQASRPPLSEDRTFYFRGETWRAAFAVVTRGAPIEGTCEIDWKETTRDGTVRRHRSTGENHQSVFVLREAEPDSGVSP